MTDIRRKVCMLGASAVGKTSLISRFVRGSFSETYLTTIGVRVDKRIVNVGDREVGLLLWDLNGEDEFQKVRPSYLRGAGGCFLVVDLTRPKTLETAKRLFVQAREVVGEVPIQLLLNKADLESQWEMSPTDSEFAELAECGMTHTSAKTGSGVIDAFHTLTKRMLEPGD